MKKSLVIVLFCLTLIELASAENMKMSIWGGYTTVKMTALNDFLSDYSYIPWAGSTITRHSIHKTEIKQGIVLGLDGDVFVNKNISYGARVEYIKPNDGKTNLIYTQTFPSSSSYIWTTNYILSTNYIPVMVGGKYAKNISKKMDVNGGLYFGYGFSSLNMKYYDSDSKNGSNNFTAFGFVSELNFAGNYNFDKNFSLGLILGYRFANLGAFKDGSTSLVYNGGKSLDADFSGANLGVSLNYKF